MRNQIREARTLITSGDAASTQAVIRKVTSVVQKMVEKGIIHKNTGSRYISRIMAQAAKKQKTATPQTAAAAAKSSSKSTAKPATK